MSNGSLRRSADSGATWPVSISGKATLNGNHTSLSIPTTTAGWMTGDDTGEVWRTTDANSAGTPSWNLTSTTPGITTRGVAGIDTLNAWVVGDGGEIKRTSDGGSTWNTFTWTDAPGGAAAGAVALSGIEGILGDADSFVTWGPGGRVLATSDGATWRDVSMALGWTILDVELISDTMAVAISYDGSIAVSTDLNLATPTWTSHSITTTSDLRDVEFSDASNGMIVGDEGMLLRTSDGGTSWSREDVDTGIDMRGLATVNASTWIAAGTGTNIVRSTDTGASWTYAIDNLDTWRDVSMASEQIGWRVGNDGAIQRTSNRGATWTTQTSNTANDLFGVRAIDTQRAVAVGRNGTIISTSNSGSTWTVRATGTTANLLKVDASEHAVWAVGDGGTIVMSGDRGTTWTVKNVAAGIYLRAVTAFSPSVVVAYGTSGTAYRTTDTGASWGTIALPSGGSHVEQARTLGGTVGYYTVGPRVYKTTDAGVTWTDRGAIGSPISAIDMVSANAVYVAQGGTVRRSFDSGGTWTAMSSASNFASHTTHALDMLDRTSGVAVGSGNMVGITGFTGTVANYQNGVSDWIGDGTEAFGACLRTTTATPTWTPNATCDQSADGVHWNGIPTLTDATAEVARTAVGDGPRNASFRFGLRVEPSEPPGELSAGLTFLVISPAV